MTRSMARELAMHCSFSLGFTTISPENLLEERLDKELFAGWVSEADLYEEIPTGKQKKYIEQLVCGVGHHGPELDDYIAKYAVNWKFERIPRTATAIMRVAMYEALYMPDIPNKVAINEAVEIAKNYEDEKTVSFINGILGTFLKMEFAEEPENASNTRD